MRSPRILSPAVGAVLLVALAGAAATAGARQRETEDELAARIQLEKNPASKAKLEIRLGRRKLDRAVNAYAGGSLEEGQKLLTAYLEQMASAWATLQASGRNAVKHPDGFRELDIALREDGRTLDDLAHRISYYDRAPIQKTHDEVDQLHHQVLVALFPTISKPADERKPAAPPERHFLPRGDAP